MKALEAFLSTGAIIENGHFIYTSGRHGKTYVNKDALYPHPSVISSLCLEMARLFKEANVEVVLAPALGGIVLTQWVGHHLSHLTGREVLAVYAEKVNSEDGFLLKRGYDQLIQNKNILILEDILTTGGSVKKVVELTRKLGGKIVGVAALCNRGAIQSSEIGNVPILKSLVELNLETWDPAECPQCKNHIPISQAVGKGGK